MIEKLLLLIPIYKKYTELRKELVEEKLRHKEEIAELKDEHQQNINKVNKYYKKKMYEKQNSTLKTSTNIR